jgi:large subunit ribosomal protein L2
MSRVIKVKPTSAGRRFLVKISHAELYKGRPKKNLVKARSKVSGRNHIGKITVRHRGGGHKNMIRQVDFKRDKLNISARVKRIEYDPIRTAHIALIVYQDGEWRYILAPQGLAIGDTVTSGENVSIKPGNCLPIRNIPLGTMIHAIEEKPNTKGIFVRTAGSWAILKAKEGDYALVALPSSEIRKFHIDCKASIGALGNAEHNLRSLGKAGASRWRGRRPTVRGVAMNPVDHPMGGGEGKASGGQPTNPQGKREAKTRHNKRTDAFIIKKRSKKRRK